MMRSKLFSFTLFLFAFSAIFVLIDEKLANDIVVSVANYNLNYCTLAFEISKRVFKSGDHYLEKCCQMLYVGDKKSISDASTIHIPPDDQQLIDQLEDCDGFFDLFPLYSNRIRSGSVDENSDFSIAYSILAHRDLTHVERLLRLIYQPQHFYCIHADKKSIGLEAKIRKLSKCFPNVMLASKSHTVVWGGDGILKATLTCLGDLLSHKNWSYYINLSAQDMPLKTNAELVQILRSWRNKSNIEITGEAAPKKVKFLYEVKFNRFGNADSVFLTDRKKENPPFNAKIMKGNLAVILARPLAEWFASSPQAAKLLAYLGDTANPDEHFWQTAIANKQNFHLEDKIAELVTPYYARYSIWKGDNWKMCKGKFIRDVCVFGAGDVRRLSNIRNFLYVNKLYKGYQTPAYECIALRNMMKNE